MTRLTQDHLSSGTAVNEADIAPSDEELASAASSGAFARMTSAIRSVAQSAAGVAASVVGLRLMVGLVLAKAAVTIIPVRGIAPSNGASPSSLPWSFIHWDALFFLRVAEHGYDPSFREGASVFPVYPLATRLVARSLHLSYGHAGLLVSWVCTFLAAWAVIEIGRLIWPDAVHHYRAAVLLVWFPASVFLFAPYSEAIFVALLAWTFVAWLKGHIYWAAGLAAIASAARPEGAVLGAALALTLLLRRQYLKFLAVGLISELGVVTATLFFWARYHHLFEQVRVQQEGWHRHFSWPFHPLVWSIDSIVRGRAVATPSVESNTIAVFLLDDLMIVAGVAACIWLVGRVRSDPQLLALATFGVLYMLVVVSNGPFGKTPESAARIIMCVVPLYLCTVRIRFERIWVALAVTSSVVAVGCQMLFNLGFWFT